MSSVKASPKSHFVGACCRRALGSPSGILCSRSCSELYNYSTTSESFNFSKIQTPHLKANRGDRQSSDKESLRNYLWAGTKENSKRKLIFLEIKNQKKVIVNYLQSNDDRNKEQNVCSKEGLKASFCARR